MPCLYFQGGIRRRVLEDKVPLLSSRNKLSPFPGEQRPSVMDARSTHLEASFTPTLSFSLHPPPSYTARIGRIHDNMRMLDTHTKFFHTNRRLHLFQPIFPIKRIIFEILAASFPILSLFFRFLFCRSLFQILELVLNREQLLSRTHMF